MARFNTWARQHPIVFGFVLAAIYAAPWIIAYLVKGHWATSPWYIAAISVIGGGVSAWMVSSKAMFRKHNVTVPVDQR